MCALHLCSLLRSAPLLKPYVLHVGCMSRAAPCMSRAATLMVPAMRMSDFPVFHDLQRNVPHSSPDCTLKGAREAFLSKVPIPESQIHAIAEGLPVSVSLHSSASGLQSWRVRSRGSQGKVCWTLWLSSGTRAPQAALSLCIVQVSSRLMHQADPEALNLGPDILRHPCAWHSPGGVLMVAR